MATLVFNIEGVLADETPDGRILNYEAIKPGRILYLLVRHAARVVIFTTNRDEGAAKAWLVRERMTKFASVHCYDPAVDPDHRKWKMEKLRDLMSLGHHIDFFVDSDPYAIQAAVEMGVNGLLVAYPSAYPGGASEGEQAYVPWYSLVETIEQQNMRRASIQAETEDDD